MWLNGKAIESATPYSVTVNSFLASGGDNFRAFNAGTAKRDTGKVDLQAMVDYMAAKAATTPRWRSTGAAPGGNRLARRRSALLSDRPGRQAEPVLAGDEHGPTDAKDSSLNIKVGEETLNPAPVNNTVDATPFDESGRSAVSVEAEGQDPDRAIR